MECSGKSTGPESPESKVSSFRMDVIPLPVPAEEKDHDHAVPNSWKFLYYVLDKEF